MIRADDQDIGGLCVEYRPTELYLSNLHLLPAWQGCGIGTALVRSLLADAAKRGLPAVTLNVLPSNIGAKRLYERIGFQVVQEDEKHHWLSLALPSAPKP